MTWVQALCLALALILVDRWLRPAKVPAIDVQLLPLNFQAVPPGYDLIITCPRVLTKVQRAAIAEQIQQALPGTRCLVLEGGVTAQVVEKQS